MSIYNLISFSGIFSLMLVAWLFSARRRIVNWRVIGWGTALQLAFAALVFLAPGSRHFFQLLNDAVIKLLAAATAGQVFVFGALGKPDTSLGFILAFQAFPVIIFFSALMGLLYYWGIMPLVIRAFAWLFARLMRVSGAESLCAASNIFVGIESMTTIRPYLRRMTRSEYCTVLAAGMATVASSMMGLYVLFLKDVIPGIAGHLISASILSAPAALVMSKIILPETEHPETLGEHVKVPPSEDAGSMDSIVSGAMAGLKLVGGVVALLIAFLGLLALADGILGWAGGRFGCALSLSGLLGKIFTPLALLIGVPPGDASFAGNLLGMRLVATEVPAYKELATAMAGGQLVHARSAVIIAYALCGFAHIASLAIFVGGTAALAPERRRDIVSVGSRALLAATLACLMTGAVAGVFCRE
ncbi:MAG: nucleoside transporter C-terminal domain-containing protein [Kiritimatiellia bacterium]